MPKFLSVILLILLIHSSSQAQTSQDRPQLFYNGKNYDRLIKNRIPQYGDGERDGCVVMGEILLDLKDCDSLHVEGWVKDRRTKDALPLVTIKVKRRNGSTEYFAADRNGYFLLKKESPITALQVIYLGYNTLNIKVNRELSL